MPDIRHILKTYWGYDNFRPLQEDIINTALRGRDCLALLPTGGGKSLCFQVPALAMDGLCLVISPLIALMKDQVANLRKKNITAFSIHSGLTRTEVKKVLEVAGNSNCKFLYVSPERLETNLFKEYLPSLNVQLIAVDEAHCISQWGYDFRPSYLRIAALREELRGVPVLALTASATAEVQDDICEKLLFEKKTVFRQSFERPNLSYSVFDVTSKINKIVDVLLKVQGTGIVYCKSRKRTREISSLLQMNGISADYYHAGLSQEERNDKQEAWIQNKIRVIVCTNAFGMGIDKPDVRVVVHADVPDCLENYYQEAGRAGRDGKRCYAVLLAGEKELKQIKEDVETRFPAVQQLRKVYESLMNHLQVAAGTGEGRYFDFDITNFVKAFDLRMNDVLPALKTFEQEEFLYFSEQVFIPAKVQVIAPRERLFELEKSNMQLDALLKTLLRSYEGIVDQDTSVHVTSIAKLMKLSTEEIILQLNELHRRAMIRYTPQKDKPQVYLMMNRIRSADLQINRERYLRRKKQYLARAEKMIEFAHTRDCRSSLIGRYFGDERMKDCGICDNCIRRKKIPLNKDAFATIEKKILAVVAEESVTTDMLLTKLQGVAKHDTHEVLRFLQLEEKVKMIDGKWMTH